MNPIRIVAANLSLRLSTLGYDVTGILPRVGEVLGNVQSNPPDLILIDVNLKRHRDGSEVAHQIHNKFPIPIIYLTTRPDLAPAIGVGRTHPCAFISKPFKKTDLQRAIESALSQIRPIEHRKNSPADVQPFILEIKKFYDMTKILVADDEVDLETLIRQKFRQKIRQHEYEFVFAANGNDAIKKIEEHPDIDMVLSDINMPEMDGLTLLSALSTSNPLLKTVMVSAYGDMENIRMAMNRGAFDFVTKPINFEDLEVTMEKTIRHVLQLKETFKAIKENNILKMYVDENVLNFMGSREYEASLTDNETVEASVAFIDICGFTAISEKESPDTVVKLLNNYFDVMVNEIIAQKGIVDKFIGDCIMAVFKGDYHLDRAIEASLSIRNKIETLPAENNFAPKVSIGINSGEMISGNIGSATLKRLDYTVIGDTVNTAQRLQSSAGHGQIVITQDAYEKVKQSFQFEKIGSVTLKNKETEAILYQVLN